MKMLNNIGIKKYAKLVSSSINGILTFLTNLYLPRVFSIEEYGFFDYFQTFFNNIINLIDSGCSTFFYLRLINANYNVGYFIYFSLFVFFVINISTSFFYSFNFFDYQLPDYSILALISIHCFVFWLLSIFQKFYDANDFTALSESIISAFKILNFLLLIVFSSFQYIGLEINLIREIIILIIVFLTTAFLFSLQNSIHFSFFSITRSDFKELFRFSQPLFFTGVLNSGLLIYEKSILLNSTSPSQLAIYSVAYKFMILGTFLTVSLSQLYIKDLAVILKSNDVNNGISNFFFQRLFKLFLLTTIISSIMYVFSELIITSLYSNSYFESVKILRILCFYPVMHVYGQIGNAVFLASGDSKFYARLTLLSFIFGLICIHLFVDKNSLYYLGSTGLVVKVLFVQFVTLVFGFIKIGLVYRTNLFFLILKLLFSLIIILSVLYFLNLLFLLVFPAVLSFVFIVFICSIIVIVNRSFFLHFN